MTRRIFPHRHLLWPALLMAGLLGPLCLPAQIASTRQTLQQQIRLTDELLQETQDQRDRTFNELRLLNRQIELRRRLLITLSEEIHTYTQEIAELDAIICAMEEDMVSVRAAYGRALREAYIHQDSESIWWAILGAGSLTEAYLTAQYYRQLGRQRQHQLELIQQSQAYLNQKSAQLTAGIAERQALIEAKQAEMVRLEASKTTQGEVYASLKAQVQGFQRKLTVQEAQLKQLIRDAEHTFLATAEVVETDYGQLFPSSQGLLPWPVPPSLGVVVQSFGRTEDPYGNQVTHDGLTIRTAQGQPVRAVHSGRVSGVQRLPLSGQVVIIEHGDYRTVYAGLSEAQVRMGDYVSAQQQLGTVWTDRRTGESLLEFLILKMPDHFLDPGQWLIGPVTARGAP